jgi:actin-like ATPase involved in cell morphogenesis
VGYRLGVDLGTTFTAAAVERDGRAEVVPLGDHAPQIPSVVFVREDGHLLVGEPAVRRGVAQPDRVAWQFKRQLGDPVPRLLGGEAFPPERLTAALLRWVVDTVVERQGAPPERLALTHPANWGPHRLAALREAVRLAEVGAVTTVSEPAAAAVHFASTERARPGDVLLVYDLGGGTFDTAVLRRTATEFELMGRPEGIAQLGGVDFDDGVFRHVLRGLGDAAADLDPDDPAVTAALARLRRECTAAKEALSTDSETVVDVVLPSAATAVRLTRPEFEDMVRPAVEQTLGCLHRALTSAGVSPDDLATVVLVGGSARIPLVAEVLGRELGRPVAVSPQPKHAVALGAALLAGGAVPAAPQPAPTPPKAAEPRRRSVPLPTGGTGRQARSEARPATTNIGPDARRLALVLAGLVVVALLLAFALPLALQPSPGAPAGLLADGTDVGTTPVLVRTLDQPVVLSTTNGAAATVTAWLGPIPLADAPLVAGGAGVLDLRPFDRFLGGPIPVEATVGDAPQVRFVVDPPAFPAASFWVPVGVALFVLAYVESLLRPVRRRRRVRLADVAGLTALGAIGGAGLALASWAMAGNVVPTWVAVAIVLAGAGVGLAGAVLLQTTVGRGGQVHKRPKQ